MYYESIQRNKRRIQLIIGVVLCMLIAWSVFLIVQRQGKTTVVVAVVPNDARVTFNDNNVGRGTHWIKDGTYTVTASKQGFETITKKVFIDEEKEQNVVTLSLAPRSDEAKEWAKAHEQDYKKNEVYGGIEASTNGKYFSSLHPITTELPYKDPYYTLGYTTNSDQSITLTIDTLSPRYRFYAVQKIRDLGYDPTDYRINFRDFDNPLEEVKDE